MKIFATLSILLVISLRERLSNHERLPRTVTSSTPTLVFDTRRFFLSPDKYTETKESPWLQSMSESLGGISGRDAVLEMLFRLRN